MRCVYTGERRNEAMTQSGGSAGSEVATVGGGCFWCTEAVFSELRGVEKVESGYAGGTTPDPSYDEVCSDTTGHAEVVKITYDPKIISYEQLLRVFFTVHDPTTLNRQGADAGTQYRSVIFYHDQGQKETAERVIRETNESKMWGRQIVTQVSPFKAFYKAEDYHQDYYKNNPTQGYCSVVIAPKVAKFRKKYQDLLKR
jgi:peptide-methionine (S)-S-oxide reductase